MLEVDIALLLVGLGFVSYFSGKTVELSTHLAQAFKVPPLIIGVVLLSLGTDMPEIANSIFSSYTGHGDINVGNALGSCLTQISLVLGLVAIIGGTIKAHRRNVLILGACATAAVALATILVLDGDLTRMEGLILVMAYGLLIALSANYTTKEHGPSRDIDLTDMRDHIPTTLAKLAVSLGFVIVGAAIIVNSVINVSTVIGLPEYFVSFFVIGLGTSLPELSVELAALRQKKYGLVLGDLMGSNITDATFALGIGPLLFPTAITAGVVIPLAGYAVLASAVIVGLFAWKEKIDKRLGAVIVAIYLLSFLIA